MKLTLNQAAKVAEVAKSTISRAIEKGRLSAVKDDLGRYQIEPSELFRVFDPSQRNTQNAQQSSQDATAVSSEVEHLKAMLKMVSDQLEDTKIDRDHWRDQAKQLALTHENADKPLSWWKKLTG